jgi:hypothetical protein
MEKVECQALPTIRPAWSGGMPIIRQAETGKAKYGGLPDSARAGIMNTFITIAAQVLQVYQRSGHKLFVGNVDLPKLAG